MKRKVTGTMEDLDDGRFVLSLETVPDTPPPKREFLFPGFAVRESGGQQPFGLYEGKTYIAIQGRDDDRTWFVYDLSDGTSSSIARHNTGVGINDHFGWTDDGYMVYLSNAHLIKQSPLKHAIGKQSSLPELPQYGQWRTTATGHLISWVGGRHRKVLQVFNGELTGKSWDVPDGSLHGIVQDRAFPDDFWVWPAVDQKFLYHASFDQPGWEEIEIVEGHNQPNGLPANFESHIAFGVGQCVFGNQINALVQCRETDPASRLSKWPITSLLSVNEIAEVYGKPGVWVAYTHAYVAGNLVIFSCLDTSVKDPEWYESGILLWDLKDHTLTRLESGIRHPKTGNWWPYFLKPAISPDGKWYCYQEGDEVVVKRVP